MTYLETAWAMFISNPLGYVATAFNLLVFVAIAALVLRVLACILGADFAPLAVKQEWDLHGRGIVVLDPNHPDYRPADRVRIHGQTVYSRYDPVEAYQQAKAHYEKLHGKMSVAELSDFDFNWQFSSLDNPVFNRDYEGHPFAAQPDPDAKDVYGLLPPVKLRHKPPK